MTDEDLRETLNLRKKYMSKYSLSNQMLALLYTITL